MAVRAVNVLDIVEVATSLIDTPSAGEPRQTHEVAEKDLQSACLFVAMGEPVEAVSRKMGINLGSLTTWLRSDAGMDLLIRLQTGLFQDPADRIKRMQHLALDTQVRLLTRGSDAVQAKVADSLLDRGSGKAIQKNDGRPVVTVTDMQNADRMLASQQEKLERLEQMRRTLVEAGRKALPAGK